MGIELATFATYATIAAAGVGVYSALEQGAAAKKAGKDAQEQADIDARNKRSESLLEANKIRKDAERRRSMAASDMAGSGVTVGVGNAELIDQEIYQDAEEDALTTILNGGKTASDIAYQGKVAARQGKNAQTASYFSALQQGAQGVYAASGSKGWKTTNPNSGSTNGSFFPVYDGNGSQFRYNA